jgi:predicted metal-dependent hydrolase
MSGFRLLDLLPPLMRAGPRRAPASLDGATLDLPGPDGVISVAVTVRPQARRMVLKIDRRSGTPHLTLPRGVGRARAERFLAQYVGWIAGRLKALPARITFEDGAVIPLHGAPTRIVHSLPFRGETRLVDENGARLLLVHGAREYVASRVMRYLKAEAERALAAASRHYAAKAEVSIGRITIKDTRSRWGSCSAKGDLAFSWRLILAPPFVLDYLAAHEVAHRLEMNHSPRYWRQVRALCPTYRDAEDWLKRHGASLHHYGP